MKIGAENKKEVAIMAVLLAVLLVVGVYNFRDVLWAGTTSLPTALAPQHTGPGTVTVAQDNEPWLQPEILEPSRAVKYEPGRNLFAMEQAPAKPQPSGHPPGEQVDWPKPDPAPQPPKIQLVFYGFANKPGEPKRVFLGAADNRNFVAGLNQIVDRRYKVVQIQSNQVIIEDMLNNNQQPVRLTPR